MKPRGASRPNSEKYPGEAKNKGHLFQGGPYREKLGYLTNAIGQGEVVPADPMIRIAIEPVTLNSLDMGSPPFGC